MIHKETPRDKIPRITYPELSEIIKSPAHFEFKYLSGLHQPELDQKAVFNSVFRCIMEQPGEFTKRFYVAPISIDRRTTDGKKQWIEWQRAADGKKIIPRADYATALDMRSAINENEIIRKIYANGVANKVFHFDDFWHEMPCSATAGWLYNGSLIVELYAVDDASGVGFSKFCKLNGLYIKTAFLKDAFERSTGDICNGVIHVAVETKPPYNFSMWQLDQFDCEIGRATYLGALERYKEGIKTGIWPGYSDKIETLQLFKG